MRAIMTLMLIVISFMLLQISNAGQPDENTPAGIQRYLDKYNSHVSPQKIYLHLDKDDYITGETIWFKAYLLDGVSHLPYSDTSNIYVEIISHEGYTVAMRILLAEQGLAAGDIDLPHELPDGNYILRAYTDWMRNFSEEFFFTRYLYINNPEYDNVIRRADARRNRRFNRRLGRMERDYEVAFFPESGNMIAGYPARVAFRVVDLLGNGQEAKGELIERDGETVTTLETDFGGIGVFEFVPDRDEEYFVRISVNDSRPSYYELPPVMQSGYALRIDQDDNQLTVSVVATQNTSEPAYNGGMILIGHTRGEPRFGQVIETGSGAATVTIDNDLFPSGIAHFTLFTPGHDPVAERLVYINNGNRLHFSPHAVTEEAGNRDFIDLMVNVTDVSGSPVEGSFSLSAVTGGEADDEYRDDFLSYIMFNSDLKGIGEDIPGYFLSAEDKDAVVDHIMLTHGWRRFDWDDVIAGNLPDTSIEPLQGLNVGGRIIDPAKNESLTNYPVRLEVKSGYDDVLETRTGRNGNFNFEGLYYEGIINVQVSSQRLPANYPPTIEMNVREGRGFDYEPVRFTRQQNVTRRGDDWTRQRRVIRSPLGLSTDRETTPQMYGVPDQTIFIDYETSTERNLYEVLRNRATGISFEGGRIMIRGPSSFYLSNEPRFMIDGMFVNPDAFLGLYPRDVQRIEIFRGTSAAIFGIRGGTGVILAYTRRPGYQGFEDALEFVMLGYHTPSEFYTDVMTVHNLTPLERRVGKTIHWDSSIRSGKDGIITTRIPLLPGTDRVVLTLEGVGFEGGIGSAEYTIDLGD